MLAISDLTIAFRRHGAPPISVLQGLSLTVTPGAVTGLVGESGAGKSLVAASIMGTLPRNANVAGSITVDGEPSAPGAVALAPQGLDALDPLVRLGTQLTRFAGLAGRKADGADLLAAVGLPSETAEAWPHMLSGGMARRALLATALATGAPYIVADEPTAGLDDNTADRVMALLADLARRGHGLLVISHDLARLVRIADELVVLRDGIPVETAPAAAFVGDGAALAHGFTRDLWRVQPSVSAC